MTSISEYLSSSSIDNFFLLAGPCVIEGHDMALDIARTIAPVCADLDIPYVFKGSYRKANRSRLDSFTGIGDLEALRILAEVREQVGVPVVTDIHSAEEARMAADFVDILQIPAFLCRQTDLLVAAARTGRAVNIKKGQFLSPASMHFALDKLRESGAREILVTDRGTTFGYGDLIVDFRGIPEMKTTCRCPVVMDATHSLQQPNTAGGVTGGRPDMIETICRAAIAVGADGLFIETHPEPAKAKSDGANMLRLELLPDLLKRLSILRQTINQIDAK